MILRNFAHALYIAAGVYALGFILTIFEINFFLKSMYSSLGILFTFLLVLAEVTYNRF
ncbi:hypothetical protein IIC68_01535 [archaeon]|nr:hypothetical protein [archaeon]